MRNNPKSLNIFPSPLSSSGFNFTSNFSPSSPQCRGMGNGGCGHIITCLCCSLSSVGGLLTLLPCSSVASLPWQSPLPWGAVLQELTAPVWVTCRFISKAPPLWALLSTCPQVLPGAHSSTSFPWGLSLLWASPAAVCPMGTTASPQSTSWAAEEPLLQYTSDAQTVLLSLTGGLGTAQPPEILILKVLLF